MENEKEEFFEDIVNCLIKYGNLGREEAETLLNTLPTYQAAKKDDKSFSILEHETPYYWAMHLLFSKDKPDWYQDPKLWPPPKDYLAKWYGTK